MEKNKLYPLVYIIIVNYNGKNVLKKCLNSVFSLDYPNFEVVIVDNASNDGSLEEAKQYFSRGHYIYSGQNIGFARGNNLGIRWALEKMADYVWLLNNDTLVEKNSLSNLIKAMQKNNAYQIVSPLIYNTKNKIWFGGGEIDWWRMRTKHWKLNHPKKEEKNSKVEEIILEKKDKSSKIDIYPSEFISGCAMLVYKKVFQKIGLLDENFFLYYEDADFSWRAHKVGFQLGIVPSAKIKHLEQSQQLNPDKIYWLVKSGLYFFFKNASWIRRQYYKIYWNLRRWKNKKVLRQNPQNHKALAVQQAYLDFSQGKIFEKSEKKK